MLSFGLLGILWPVVSSWWPEVSLDMAVATRKHALLTWLTFYFCWTVQH